MENTLLTVSDFVALTNQILDTALPTVVIEGEVASFKVNQGKYVFFDLKDQTSTVSCFMSLYSLRTPLEDGMKVIVTAAPKLTQWGRFSLTVKSYRPSGEGSLKKSFELLKAKLEKEGIFAPERKRTLPRVPRYVGVISSTQAAGYMDFIKILNERWGGLKVDVAHVQVQGSVAPDQIISAIRHFNGLEELPEVLVIIRGGGSADDLSAFNDEPLVRAIAESRIPTMTGIGHEVDESLADLAADVRASTPSNAAQMLVPDREEIIMAIHSQVAGVRSMIVQSIDYMSRQVRDSLAQALRTTTQQLDIAFDRLSILKLATQQVNPRNVLKRGYALLRGSQKVGGTLEIETFTTILETEVKDVRKK
jgi:exodeoxyribonuclease VII large subunit